jgi:zinc protease
MKRFTYGFLLAFVTLFTLNVYAGNKDDEKAPLDPEIIYGKLDNGFTYYIRKNQLPPERAYMYLLVNAGAMNESPEQNGLAHFCEHMAFNGTENYPGHDLRKYLESRGMSFGGGFNAYTAQDRTVYMLNQIPTTDQNLMDSCYLIMHDWASAVKYETSEIEKERGVIHEEWRVRGGANRRMRDATNPVYYNGSRYAEHNVIGKLDVIDHCDPELLRQFYQDWYRPDNEAIVVIGDVDIEATRAKIKAIFGGIEKPQKNMAEIDYSVQENQGYTAAVATDPEASRVTINLAIRQPKDTIKNIGSIKKSFVKDLYFEMFDARISELTSKPNPPFIIGYAYYSSFSEYLDAFNAGVYPMQDKPLEGFAAMLTELERVKRYGFTASELERAKIKMLSDSEKAYNNRDKQESRKLIGQIMNHYYNDYQATSIEYRHQLKNDYLTHITLDQVNTLSNNFFKDDFGGIVFHAPQKEGIVVPSEQDLIEVLNKVKKSELTAYVDDVASAPLIAELPQPGTIAKSEKISAFNGEKFTLSNGAKIVFNYSDNKDDEILLTAYSTGGKALYKDEDIPSLEIMSSAATFSGLGEFSKTQLDKKLSGKQVNLSAYINDNEEGFNGSSNVNDFETLLQLLHLRFTAPRIDEEGFNAYRQRLGSFLENRSLDPRTTFYDTLTVVGSNYNPRVKIEDKTFFDEADYSRAMEIYKERMAGANNFTFIFTGNVQAETMKPLIEQYIGSLPSFNVSEQAMDDGVRPPKGKVTRRFSREMKDPQGYSRIQYWGDMQYNLTNEFNMDALSYILRMRCVDQVREEEGGTYGVAVYGRITKDPKEIYSFLTHFNCDPEKVDTLNTIIYKLIDEFKAKGPTEEELTATKEYFLKMKNENLKDNKELQTAAKTYLEDGYYIYDNEHYEDIINKISKNSIQKMAQDVFGNNVMEVVMTPPITKE